ncbi:MAG: chemotaxis protein CheW, partial [Myxococcota bacterium]
SQQRYAALAQGQQFVARGHPCHLVCERVEEGIVLVLEADGSQFALLVDEVIGQLQTVIKSLGDFLKHTPGLSGCTILGDGEVSLILDVSAMRQSIRGRGRAAA